MRRYGAWSRQAGTLWTARLAAAVLEVSWTPPFVRSRARAVTEESSVCVHLSFWRNLSWLVRLARRLHEAQTLLTRPYDELV